MHLSEEFKKNIKVLGRTSSEEPYVLFWTGSRYEMNVKASSLSVKIRASYGNQEQWICVLVDGVRLIRMPLSNGENEIMILRNRNREQEHNIRIVKDTPIMPGDGEHYIELTDVLIDGELLPVPERKHKLLFIGDSITSGEGAIGARGENDWVSELFSATDNYAYMTAELVDADYQSLSQSGWGVCCGYDNDTRHVMPIAWDKVCALAYADGPVRPIRGAEKDYDFQAFVPDAIIINLGTNDANGVTMPPMKNPDTGVTFGMKLAEDGSLSKESAKAFLNSAVPFLSKIYEAYPKAKLYWTYGMLGTLLEPVIKEALSTFAKLHQTECPEYIALPEITNDTVGARFHPGLPCHRQTANRIAGVLNRYFQQLEGEGDLQ